MYDVRVDLEPARMTLHDHTKPDQRPTFDRERVARVLMWFGFLILLVGLLFAGKFLFQHYRMTTTRLLITFASLLGTYSLLLLVCYRSLTRPAGVRLSQSTTPIETTTAEERSRGESSFIIRQEHRFGVARRGFFLLAALGYIVLFVGFLIALLRSNHE